MTRLRLIVGLGLLVLGLVLQAVAMPSNTVYLGGAGREATAPALAAHRQRMHRYSRTMAQLKEYLVRRRVLSPRTVMPQVDSFVVLGTANRTAVTRGTRYGGGTLTFAYDGWGAVDQQNLNAFLTRAYPVLVDLYGAPTTTGTLTIAAAGVQDNVEGGEFVIDPDSGAMTLRVGPLPDDFTSGDYGHYGFDLLHLVLHAFHAPALLGFDAWEEGMARAAALVASTLLNPDYDVALDGGYLLPIYDNLNQPALSNSTFFPAQGNAMMSLYRLGMAMSAWLKIYAEYPNAFVDFNTRYYAALAGNPALPGSVLLLRGTMAQAAPTVEGLTFQDWYDRQYILRPTAVVGNRIFAHYTPLHEHVPLVLYYFLTNADGSERPLSGTATLEYYSFDQLPLYPEEGDQVLIGASGELAGIGAIDPGFYNIGETAIQRVRIVVNLGGQRVTLYYAYYVQGYIFDTHGNVTDANEIFGAVVGADDGDLYVALPGRSLQTKVVQGAFGLQLTTSELGMTYFTPAVFTFSSGGKEVSIRRNIGPWSYSPVLVVGLESAGTLTHSFLSGPALVSFPLTPQAADAATLFGYLPNAPDFRFAGWDPAAQGGGAYLHYPAAPPIVPGRGYWLNLPIPRTVSIAGTQLLDDDPRTITLAPGWNLIGNTFNAVINPWAMTVEDAQTGYTLNEAIRLGKTGPVWTYNPQASYEVKGEMAAWEGGWINNLTDQPLTLRQQGANRTRGMSENAMRLLTDGGWGIALQARTTTARDAMTVLGVTGRARQDVDALDWLKPPAFDNGVRVAFIHPARRIAGAAYATDMRAGVGAQGETWEFEVASRQQGTVTLSWPDLRGLPPQYQATLEDIAAGTRQYMRTTATYQYQSTGTPATPDTRRFRLVVAPRSERPLSFVNLHVRSTRGNGASLQVTMSAPADLTLEVRSLAGKLVRIIRIPASRANEPILIPWDGRGAGGKLVPSGTYMLNLTARTAEGFVIRRNQTMVLRR